MNGEVRMKRILIVDDQQAICTMIRTLFTDNKDYSFAEAYNGVEAQELVRKESFDLVITDVIMPDCDGIELIMTLLRQQPDLKVIVISGGGRVRAEHYLNLAEKLGATRVFEKPLDSGELRTAVDELLSEPSA
jgi:DNA-binding NtrC family response regulator